MHLKITVIIKKVELDQADNEIHYNKLWFVDLMC